MPGLTQGIPAAVLPLTGNEVIQLDTELTGGVNPATEIVTLNQLGSQTLGTVTGGLTATAGGAQAGALVLPSRTNVVTVVTTANDSVKLPPGTFVGQTVDVTNASANNAVLFPSTTQADTINGNTTTTGITVVARSFRRLIVLSIAGGVAAWGG
jgi:hypothetical protein